MPIKPDSTRRVPTEIARRLKQCRQQFRGARADAFLLTNEVDYFYLTGFTAEESAVLLTGSAVHLITDSRFLNEVKRDCPFARVWMRKGLLNDEIANACTKLMVKRLAVQANHFTIGDQADFKKRLPGVRVVPAPPTVVELRRLKSAAELKTMGEAIRVAEEAFLSTQDSIRAGQTELDLAARLEYEMRKRGASSPAFPTICAEGPNAASPHAKPGKRKIHKGSAILIDWGARVQGYNSDLTRMVFFGSVSSPIREVFDVVLAAQIEAIGAVRPGRRMCDIDAVARKVIADAGYGDRFTHGLGHGLGLDVHEPPSLSWRSEEELTPGMVVTVEPGVYLPGVGGVRIEDDVVVTERGCRVMTRLPKSLLDAVL